MVVDQVDTFKYLGVKLDPKLSFSHHVNYIKSKTISKIKILKRVRSLIDRDTSITLYKSLILPHFDYCSVVSTVSHRRIVIAFKKCRTVPSIQYSMRADTPLSISCMMP